MQRGSVGRSVEGGGGAVPLPDENSYVHCTGGGKTTASATKGKKRLFHLQIYHFKTHPVTSHFLPSFLHLSSDFDGTVIPLAIAQGHARGPLTVSSQSPDPAWRGDGPTPPRSPRTFGSNMISKVNRVGTKSALQSTSIPGSFHATQFIHLFLDPELTPDRGRFGELAIFRLRGRWGNCNYG